MGLLWRLALSIQFLFLYSLFSCTLTNCFPFLQHTQCHEDESHALLQFKQAFLINKSVSLDPYSYPKTASWMPSTNCCLWDGIECDESTGYVIGINLTSSQLYGSFDANSTLFHLVHLQRLDLSDNDFNYSQIPSRIGELSQLRYLNLAQTTFSGEIPQEISHLSKLLSLDLHSYIFASFYSDGPAPINLLELRISDLRRLIQNSTRLEVLHLSFVTISSSVPNTLTNLTSLQILSLFHCKLYGEFPIEIFHLPNLRVLNLVLNQDLTGKLPDFHSGALLSKLMLDETSFHGTLPASIGNLNFLSMLSISRCSFSGSIPSSLANLTQLVDIDLSHNKFRGHLSSSLANLTKLSALYVGFNEFAPESISWICKLSRIRQLDLSSLSTGSKIPLCFANLTELSVLSLKNSNLSGEKIPSWIMNLTNLDFLDLSENSLHGEIPYSLFRLENLAILSLTDNLLQGQLELDMFLKLKMLTYLSLSNNQLSLLTGKSSTNATHSSIQVLALGSCNLVEIPNFLVDMDELAALYMANNSIKSLPRWMWKKTSLLELTVSQNSLIGEVSPLICNLKSLVRLDLSFNNLSGIIPSCLGSFSQSLQFLRLQGNNLIGLIPPTYMMKSSLKMIDFSDNNLKGQLPRALVNCRMLEYLDVSYNQINDSFPFWLGELPELKVIALRNSEFHGAIRCPRPCTFPKLHIIDLAHNDFSGNLPSKIFQNWKSMRTSNISHLEYEQLKMKMLVQGKYTTNNDYSLTISSIMIAIDLSSNRISGEIPSVMGELNGLIVLSLSNNMLTGSIPSSLGKLSNLEKLDLSRNSLSGKIPQQLTQLTFLAFFNVSFNNLSGPIPQGNQFSTFEGNSFEGNLGLCGNQLLKKCKDHEGHSIAPPSASNGDQDSGSFLEFDWKVVLIGYGGGLIAGLALGSTYSPAILGWLRRVF